MGVCLLARLQHVAMRRLATINDVATGYFSSYTEVSIVCVLWNMDIILSTVRLNFGTKNCTDLQDVTGRIVWCSRTRWYGVVRTTNCCINKKCKICLARAVFINWSFCWVSRKSRCFVYTVWNDVTESMVTIRSPSCGYNTIYCVELNGEDSLCYSN